MIMARMVRLELLPTGRCQCWLVLTILLLSFRTMIGTGVNILNKEFDNKQCNMSTQISYSHTIQQSQLH